MSLHLASSASFWRVSFHFHFHFHFHFNAICCCFALASAAAMSAASPNLASKWKRIQRSLIATYLRAACALIYWAAGQINPPKIVKNSGFRSPQPENRPLRKFSRCVDVQNARKQSPIGSAPTAQSKMPTSSPPTRCLRALHLPRQVVDFWHAVCRRWLMNWG